MKAILNGKAVVGMLREFGLSAYEARMYFVLLTLGESKVAALTKRAYVRQSKGYEILDRLIEKGFVEQTNGEKPNICILFIELIKTRQICFTSLK